MARITINDVAREAGVHRSTVSRALTGSGPVSGANRERVIQAAKKLNYHPNSLAGALKSRRRNTWGLLSFWSCSPNSMDYYYSKSLGGLLDSAGSLNYRVLLQNFEGRFDDNPQCNRFCHEAQLGGLVLLAPRCQDEALAQVRDLGIPVVLLAYRPDISGLSYVDLDNMEGARIAVKHLVDKGHKKIAYIGGELNFSANARDRYAGYLKGLSQAGLAENTKLVRNGLFDPDHARQATREFLSLPASEKPTAVFCATDTMAHAAIEEARNRGLAVPQDLAVVGFDNNPQLPSTGPGLTTVHFPFYDAALRAGEILKQHAENENADPVGELIKPELVIRESSG